jgi:hypothetical protein
MYQAVAIPGSLSHHSIIGIKNEPGIATSTVRPAVMKINTPAHQATFQPSGSIVTATSTDCVYECIVTAPPIRWPTEISDKAPAAVLPFFDLSSSLTSAAKRAQQCKLHDKKQGIGRGHCPRGLARVLLQMRRRNLLQ